MAGGHDGSPNPEEGIKIKKGKLRGVPSFGMMCSVEELGTSRDMYPEAPEEGIYIFQKDVKPGDDAVEAMGLRDQVVEFEITSNRVDCFSMIGMAREAAATFRKEFHPPVVTKTGNGEDVNDFIKVDRRGHRSLSALYGKGCEKYQTGTVAGMDAEKTCSYGNPSD